MKKLFILLIIITSACETPVDPDIPDEGSGIVVYSFFRPGTPIILDVFETVPIQEAESVVRFNNLSIQLFEENVPVETIRANTQKMYVGTTIPEEGKTYEIIVNANTVTLSAVNRVPKAVPIQTAYLTEEIVDFNIDEYGYPAGISLEDPAGENNYYAIEVFVENCMEGCNDSTISGNLNELLVEDVKVNTSGNTEVNIGAGPESLDGLQFIYFSDLGVDGETIGIDFFLVPTLLDFEETQNKTVKFILKSISQSYYEYMLTADYQKKIEEEGTFAEPVQIKSNITNGLGVFAAYNYTIYNYNINH